MSGGSFGYLYFKIEDAPLDEGSLEMLGKMAAWLAEQGQAPAAQELTRVHEQLSALRKLALATVRVRGFLNLLEAAEWWCSGDIDQKDFEDVWRKYAKPE